jgi:hypothetical protein
MSISSKHDCILLKHQEVEETDLPVCGRNLSSPVTDTANYINEIHYQIGSRRYIENTD